MSKKKKKNKINEGHYLELMDRLYMIMNNIEDHTITHPLTNDKRFKKVKKKIQKGQSILFDAYSMVAHLDVKHND